MKPYRVNILFVGAQEWKVSAENDFFSAMEVLCGKETWNGRRVRFGRQYADRTIIVKGHRNWTPEKRIEFISEELGRKSSTEEEITWRNKFDLLIIIAEANSIVEDSNGGAAMRSIVGTSRFAMQNASRYEDALLVLKMPKEICRLHDKSVGGFRLRIALTKTLCGINDSVVSVSKRFVNAWNSISPLEYLAQFRDSLLSNSGNTVPFYPSLMFLLDDRLSYGYIEILSEIINRCYRKDKLQLNLNNGIFNLNKNKVMKKSKTIRLAVIGYPTTGKTFFLQDVYGAIARNLGYEGVFDAIHGTSHFSTIWHNTHNLEEGVAETNSADSRFLYYMEFVRNRISNITFSPFKLYTMNIAGEHLNEDGQKMADNIIGWLEGDGRNIFLRLDRENEIVIKQVIDIKNRKCYNLERNEDDEAWPKLKEQMYEQKRKETEQENGIGQQEDVQNNSNKDTGNTRAINSKDVEYRFNDQAGSIEDVINKINRIRRLDRFFINHKKIGKRFHSHKRYIESREYISLPNAIKSNNIDLDLEELAAIVCSFGFGNETNEERKKTLIRIKNYLFLLKSTDVVMCDRLFMEDTNVQGKTIQPLNNLLPILNVFVNRQGYPCEHVNKFMVYRGADGLVSQQWFYNNWNSAEGETWQKVDSVYNNYLKEMFDHYTNMTQTVMNMNFIDNKYVDKERGISYCVVPTGVRDGNPLDRRINHRVLSNSDFIRNDVELGMPIYLCSSPMLNNGTICSLCMIVKGEKLKKGLNKVLAKKEFDENLLKREFETELSKEEYDKDLTSEKKEELKNKLVKKISDDLRIDNNTLYEKTIVDQLLKNIDRKDIDAVINECFVGNCFGGDDPANRIRFGTQQLVINMLYRHGLCKAYNYGENNILRYIITGEN